MVLWFRFVTKTMLNIFISPYTPSRLPLLLILLWMGKKVGEDRDGTTNKKGYSRTYGSMLSDKSWKERRRKGPRSGLQCLFSHITIRPDVDLLSWRWLNAVLPNQPMNSYICTAFAMLVKLCLNPRVFSLLLFFLSSIPLRGNGEGVWMWMWCVREQLWGPTQSLQLNKIHTASVKTCKLLILIFTWDNIMMQQMAISDWALQYRVFITQKYWLGKA